MQNQTIRNFRVEFHSLQINGQSTCLLLLAVCLVLGTAFTCQTHAASGKIPGPQTEVRMLMGRPAFFLDGKPFTDPLFATYAVEQRFFDQMAAKAGIKLFNFTTTCGEMYYSQHAKPVWIGPDEWDFAQMDERARMILKADPNALILPRIYIGAPKFWRDQNPDEMIVLDTGSKLYTKPFNDAIAPKADQRPIESIASLKWRQDMGMALRKVIEHMQNSDYGKHIFGYQLSAMATEEWYPFGTNQEQLSDYSPNFRKAFQNWLQAHYETPEALRQVWNNPQVNFDNAQIPTPAERKRVSSTFRDPATEMNVIDFYRFYSDIIPETLEYFAKVAKDASGHQKVIGAFYGYFYEFAASVEHAHNAVGKALRSPDLDFLMAPPSYYERQVGSGAELYRRPFLSGTLHGKMWFHDNDLASFRFDKVMQRHRENPKLDPYLNPETMALSKVVLAVQPTAQQTIWQFQRAAGYALCEGINESYFDLHGGYYDDPRLLYSLGQIAGMFERSQKQDRSSVAQVLVVADEISAAYHTYQSDPKAGWNRINESLKAHQLGFIKAGAPFDSIFLDDLKLVNLDQYKMIVFLNTYQMDQASREFVDRQVKRDERTVVWCYAPGLFDRNSQSAEAMQKLTGINIVPASDETFIEPKSLLTASAREWMKMLGETPPENPVGQGGKVCKLFSVQDEAAEAFGVLPGTKTVTMARKAMKGWTSIYLLSAVMPPNLVRALEKSAGVHIYNTGNDALYANQSYLTINGATAGDKTIELPFAADVHDALTEDLLYKNVTRFDTSLMVGETQIFRYRPVAKRDAP